MSDMRIPLLLLLLRHSFIIYTLCYELSPHIFDPYLHMATSEM